MHLKIYITVVLGMSTETTLGNLGASGNEADKVKAKEPNWKWNEPPSYGSQKCN